MNLFDIKIRGHFVMRNFSNRLDLIPLRFLVKGKHIVIKILNRNLLIFYSLSHLFIVFHFLSPQLVFLLNFFLLLYFSFLLNLSFLLNFPLLFPPYLLQPFFFLSLLFLFILLLPLHYLLLDQDLILPIRLVSLVNLHHFIPAFTTNKSVQLSTKILLLPLLLLNLLHQNILKSVTKFHLPLRISLVVVL